MDLEMKAKASQVTPVLTNEADPGFPSMTKLGALFTADWKQQLILAGLAWGAHVGGITASADILPVVGGGNGSAIDTAKPELVIGIPAGFYMIPLEAHVACYDDPVTDNAIGNIVLFADRSAQTSEASVSGTVVTPFNLLDGGGTFPGSCYKAVTGELLVAPICDEILDYKCNQLGCTTGGSSIFQLSMDYMPETPSILAGPCQIVLCWGGTAASGMGVVKIAVVPTSYFPTS